MLRIPLTQGKFALLDDVDSDLMYQNWHTRISTNGKSTRWYASHKGLQINWKRAPYVHMHRIVLERKLGRPLKFGEETDHSNHDTLDNRRDNLRAVSGSENQRNQQVQKRPKYSQYKGVTWIKADTKWMAQIQIVKNKTTYLGRFDKEIDAAKAYDQAAIKHFGKHACLNFPEDQ